jgi:hypothetical protein
MSGSIRILDLLILSKVLVWINCLNCCNTKSKLSSHLAFRNVQTISLTELFLSITRREYSYCPA